jgi:60 kDa SS-A/Ro ribonucleoprotein
MGSWEVALSSGADKHQVWERLLREQKLGALALLRNLRNMREAGVSDKLVARALGEMKTDRVLPFRFIAAARYAPQHEPELEQAMFRSLKSQTPLPGTTALVVDTSPSMWMGRLSRNSDMDRFEAAAGLAILLRETAERVNVYAFNEKAYEVPPRRGFALRDALAATKNNWSRGGLAVAAANRDGYDRIIVITDGQWHFSDTTTVQGYGEGDPQTVAPAPLTKQAYMINVASYKNGVGYGKWMNIDGWSDSVIEYIRALEQTKWVN